MTTLSKMATRGPPIEISCLDEPLMMQRLSEIIDVWERKNVEALTKLQTLSAQGDFPLNVNAGVMNSPGSFDATIDQVTESMWEIFLLQRQCMTDMRSQLGTISRSLCYSKPTPGAVETLPWVDLEAHKLEDLGKKVVHVTNLLHAISETLPSLAHHNETTVQNQDIGEQVLKNVLKWREELIKEAEDDFKELCLAQSEAGDTEKAGATCVNEGHKLCRLTSLFINRTENLMSNLEVMKIKRLKGHDFKTECTLAKNSIADLRLKCTTVNAPRKTCFFNGFEVLTTLCLDSERALENFLRTVDMADFRVDIATNALRVTAARCRDLHRETRETCDNHARNSMCPSELNAVTERLSVLSLKNRQFSRHLDHNFEMFDNTASRLNSVAVSSHRREVSEKNYFIQTKAAAEIAIVKNNWGSYQSIFQAFISTYKDSILVPYSQLKEHLARNKSPTRLMQKRIDKLRVDLQVRIQKMDNICQILAYGAHRSLDKFTTVNSLKFERRM